MGVKILFIWLRRFVGSKRKRGNWCCASGALPIIGQEVTWKVSSSSSVQERPCEAMCTWSWPACGVCGPSSPTVLKKRYRIGKSDNPWTFYIEACLTCTRNCPVKFPDWRQITPKWQLDLIAQNNSFQMWNGESREQCYAIEFLCQSFFTFVLTTLVTNFWGKHTFHQSSNLILMYGGVQLNVQPAFNEFVLIFIWCFILTKGDENKYIGYLKRTCKERWKGTKKQKML